MLGWAVAGGVAHGQPGLPDPYALIAAAIDQTRGTTFYAATSMSVHRPEWERATSLVAWTLDRGDALIRFAGPAKNVGNLTIKNNQK